MEGTKDIVGKTDGTADGKLDIDFEGNEEGSWDGWTDREGGTDGVQDGLVDGAMEGRDDGSDDGSFVGDKVAGLSSDRRKEMQCCTIWVIWNPFGKLLSGDFLHFFLPLLGLLNTKG